MELQDLKECKKNLRKEIAALKKMHDVQWKKAASDIIAARLADMELFQKSDTILLYHALPDEVQTLGLLDRFYKEKRILIPLVKGDDLILKLYDPAKIVPGYKNIPEPSEDAVTVSPEEVELAVVPGVAFDPSCNRLGRGKGFYDRLIPHMNCPLVGVGYQFQVVESIPCESFDRKLDMVLTEENVYRK